MAFMENESWGFTRCMCMKSRLLEPVLKLSKYIHCLIPKEKEKNVSKNSIPSFHPHCNVSVYQSQVILETKWEVGKLHENSIKT